MLGDPGPRTQHNNWKRRTRTGQESWAGSHEAAEFIIQPRFAGPAPGGQGQTLHGRSEEYTQLTGSLAPRAVGAEPAGHTGERSGDSGCPIRPSNSLRSNGLIGRIAAIRDGGGIQNRLSDNRIGGQPAALMYWETIG